MGEQFIPIFFIGPGWENPGVPFSTTKAWIGRSASGTCCPRSILAYTTEMSANGALVMNVFCPFKT